MTEGQSSLFLQLTKYIIDEIMNPTFLSLIISLQQSNMCHNSSFRNHYWNIDQFWPCNTINFILIRMTHMENTSLLTSLGLFVHTVFFLYQLLCFLKLREKSLIQESWEKFPDQSHNIWCTSTKQGTSDILEKNEFLVSLSFIVSKLSALIWYQNQVHTPPTFWNTWQFVYKTICSFSRREVWFWKIAL